jgi:hypothetical protein
MSSDRPEGITTSNNNSATGLSGDDPVMGDEQLEPDHRSEDGPAVEQRDVAQVDVDPRRRSDDADASNPRGEALFSTEDTENLRRQWNAAQSAFVDDPRVAVERADHLVVETIRTLSNSFNQERSRLEEQWVRGESVSTEDLRVALRLYRSFFDRLLSI